MKQINVNIDVRNMKKKIDKIRYTLNIYLVSNIITLNYRNKKECQELFDSIDTNLAGHNNTFFTVSGQDTTSYLIRYKYITHVGMTKNVQETETSTPE
jgi:hypothetical protein